MGGGSRVGVGSRAIGWTGLGWTMCFDLKKLFCQVGNMPPYAIGSVRVDPRMWVMGMCGIL